MVKRQGILRLLLGWAVVFAVMGMAASTAAATNYIFEPRLSLTGDCTTSTDDEVPDPGCPYPPFPEGPSESFIRTTGIALDPYGDIYVGVEGKAEEDEAHIDIFNPEGLFITEFAVPESLGIPRSVAVDGKGYLYVYVLGASSTKLLRYDPKALSYDPANGKIAYEPTPTVVSQGGSDYAALAVNPLNNHLFVNFGVKRVDLGTFVRSAVVEFGSGEEGTPLLNNEVAEVCCFDGPGLAIDATRGRMYVPDETESTGAVVIRVFELGGSHNLIETIDGSSTPQGKFLTETLSLAVDESTGNLLVYQQEGILAIYELTEHGQYISMTQHSLTSKERKQQVAIDNGAKSPHGILSTEGRYMWATTAPPGAIGHAYAFQPSQVSPPEVKSVFFGEVSEEEALLRATIDSGQAETSYSFEYVSKAQFDVSGFEGAQLAGQGTIPAGKLPVAVSAEATGLSPGTAYVFRVHAANEAGSDEGEGEFKTYAAFIKAPCPNDEFRTGASAALSDCRAYELVTPADTAGRSPMGLGLSSVSFPSLPASPAGDKVPFRIEGGLIPGSEGTASLSGDPYLASRGPGGWSTVSTGGKASEASEVAPGGRSPDQGYSVWAARGRGPAVIGGTPTNYLRYPDGHSELVGKGSLAVDPTAVPALISEGGGHILFVSQVHLEQASPPSGQFAVYDRTPDGVTHVASLLPDGSTPVEPQKVAYRGSSLDGLGIAFTVSQGGISTLYLRYAGKTYEIGNELTFEGVAEGGKRIFFLEAGKLYAFDVEGGKIAFATGGSLTVVNVSADGTTAYLVSTTRLTSAPNPLGAKAVTGKENLYRSREGAISFVGTVSEKDVLGEELNVKVNGLRFWARAVGGEGDGTAGRFASDPSRTTADGNVLLFQSNADLTGYESGGFREIYRYDFAANALGCLSCNPTGAPPNGGASLQDISQSSENDPRPNTAFDVVKNLSSSGRRAFFQSSDPLVAGDIDGLQDVYEWEAQGMGSCTTPGGCLYLISSGHSEKTNYLYAASENGDDVFFSTSDTMGHADGDATPSIYDARVGGGFAEPVSGECEGEGCRPALTPPPPLPAPGAVPSPKSGNVQPKCPKGKRRVKRHGKVRCVKERHHHRHRHPTGVSK